MLASLLQPSSLALGGGEGHARDRHNSADTNVQKIDLEWLCTTSQVPVGTSQIPFTVQISNFFLEHKDWASELEPSKDG